MPRSSTSRPTTAGSGRRLAAVGAVVAAEVGEVDGLVDVGVPAAAAVLGVRGVLELGQRERVVLDAEVRAAPRVAAAEVGDQRVVGVEHERRCARRGARRARPSGRRSCRARRSGRAGRGTGWRAASRAARAPRRPAPSQNSSTSNSPRSPSSSRPPRRAAAASALATPPAMFAPARLWTSRVPVRSRTVDDHRRRRRLAVGGARSRRCRARAGPASSPIACGSRRVSTLPGQRGAAAAAGGAGERADGLRGRQPGGEPQRHGASTRSAPGSDVDGGGQVGDRVAVGVGRERAVGVEGDARAPRSRSDPGLVARGCP